MCNGQSRPAVSLQVEQIFDLAELRAVNATWLLLGPWSKLVILRGLCREYEERIRELCRDYMGDVWNFY